MNKRVISVLLVLFLLFSLLPISSLAAQTRASDYIFSTSASLSTGASPGQIKLSYSVCSAVGIADSIGISKIEVYRSNGTLYKTIYGSISNGLMGTNAASKSGNYTTACSAGSSYYCVVTFTVSKGGGGDTYTTTTNTATAHT